MSEMEEYGWVVDYLPEGRSDEREREPLSQIVGEKFFTLLEIIPKEGTTLSIEQRIYIGKEDREEVDHIKRRISYDELTNSAKNELPTVLKKIIHSREEDFVRFFNKCGPVSIRLHQLELLPGVGKKHLKEILERREEKEFQSFEDIKERVTLLPDPVNILVLRIEEEVQEASKYNLFVKPPFKRRQ